MLIPEHEHARVCHALPIVHVLCVRALAFLFASEEVDKLSAHPCARRELDGSLVNAVCDLISSVMLMLFAQASDAVCERSSEPLSALFEEWSSWWSSDLQTWHISLPVSAHSQPSEEPR